MAKWLVRTAEPKSVAEREIWTHPAKGTIVRETLFRWGSYWVYTDDDQPPEFELTEVPGGDGVADSVDMHFCGYDTELVSLNDGCHLIITWPVDMTEEERQHLEDVWDEDGFDGWEAQGWQNDDNEVWFWGELDIDRVEDSDDDEDDGHDDDGVDDDAGAGTSAFAALLGSVLSAASETAAPDDRTPWFPSDVNPVRNGRYEVETLHTVVWPDLPVNDAIWTGSGWVDDTGRDVAIKCWRGLNHPPSAGA